jgi:hypothetical protein
MSAVQAEQAARLTPRVVLQKLDDSYLPGLSLTLRLDLDPRRPSTKYTDGHSPTRACRFACRQHARLMVRPNSACAPQICRSLFVLGLLALDLFPRRPPVRVRAPVHGHQRSRSPPEAAKVYRKGELSKAMMDHQWPHQVALPSCRGMGHQRFPRGKPRRLGRGERLVSRP